MSSTRSISNKKKRDSPEIGTQTCSKCSKELDIKMFRVYYYRERKFGEEMGKRIKKRVSVCKKCTTKNDYPKDENGKRLPKLTCKNLKIQQWSDEIESDNSTVKGAKGSNKTTEK